MSTSKEIGCLQESKCSKVCWSCKSVSGDFRDSHICQTSIGLDMLTFVHILMVATCPNGCGPCVCYDFCLHHYCCCASLLASFAAIGPFAVIEQMATVELGASYYFVTCCCWVICIYDGKAELVAVM